MLLLQPHWQSEQASHSTSVFLRNLIYKSGVMFGGCLSNQGPWQIVVIAPNLFFFFPLPFKREKETCPHFCLDHKVSAVCFGGRGHRVGWRDLGKASWYRYLQRIRLGWCRKEEGSTSQWLDWRALESGVPNMTLGKVPVRERKSITCPGSYSWTWQSWELDFEKPKVYAFPIASFCPLTESLRNNCRCRPQGWKAAKNSVALPSVWLFEGMLQVSWYFRNQRHRW